MRFPLALFSSPEQARWRLHLLSVLLGFGLLVGAIYLYFDYKIRQLEQQQRQLIQAQP